MVTKISTQILQYISEHTYIPDNMKDIYLYGIEITISSMLNVILVFLCSLIIGEVIAGLVYLTIFVFLRSFTVSAKPPCGLNKRGKSGKLSPKRSKEV